MQVLPFALLWFVVGACGERGGLQEQTLVPRGVGREKEFQEKLLWKPGGMGSRQAPFCSRVAGHLPKQQWRDQQTFGVF